MHQLACYHSLLLLWKVKEYEIPHNNPKNIEKSKNNRGRLKITRWIWSVKAIEIFDELPLEIRKCDKISVLKKLLRKWIKENILIEEQV